MNKEDTPIYIDTIANHLNVSVNEWREMKEGGYLIKVKEIEEAKQDLLTLLEEKVKESIKHLQGHNPVGNEEYLQGAIDSKKDLLSTIEELKK